MRSRSEANKDLPVFSCHRMDLDQVHYMQIVVTGCINACSKVLLLSAVHGGCQRQYINVV